MSRPPRILVAGGVYHVVARGNERKAVFRDDADRTTFLELCAMSAHELGVEVIAWMLRPTPPPLASLLAGGGDRAALAAAITNGYSLREIAAHVGVHASTISRRLRGQPLEVDRAESR